jgi:hypothetical protein
VKHGTIERGLWITRKESINPCSCPQSGEAINHSTQRNNMKSIITITAAILMTGCSTFLPHDQPQSNLQLVPDQTKNIVGASCRNFILQPSPAIEKALEDLKRAANGRKHTEPVCKHTEHAGFGASCGAYWSQIVCEATIED